MEDRLDEAIDLLIAGSAPRSASKELQAMLAVASDVREQLSESISPTVRARHVRELMEAARPAPSVDALPARRGTTWGKRRILRPVAALGLAVVLALPATAAVAQSAEPDDALYGTKLAVEKVQLALESDPTEDAELHLRFAERRLGEINSASANGKSKGLNRALANLNEHLAEIEDGLDEVGSAKTREDLEAHLAEVRQKHVDVLEGLAVDAGCIVGDQPIAEPEGRCKGLLNALENSSKFLEGETPGQAGDNPGQGKGAGGTGQGRPQETGKASDTTTSRGRSGSTPAPSGQSARP